MMKIQSARPLTSAEKTLLTSLDRSKLPRHIAIIMDGNGRWAARRHLPRVMGHRAGARAVREVVEACAELSVGVLTLYAFSTENWARPRGEVNALMTLLDRYLEKELRTMQKHNIRLSTIGDITKLPAHSRRSVDRVHRATEGNTGMVLNLALNYGGRDELVRAVQRIVNERVLTVTGQVLANHLDTAGMPDPDILIRTSDEQRISNFLLWQIAYTEFFVTPTLWPDFSREHLYEALVDYAGRVRRFGGVRA